MPEQGAQLKLYFPSMNEDDVVAIQSVRTEALTPDAPAPAAMAAASSAQTSSGSAPESIAARKERKMSDPGTKSFANPQGKEVSLSGSDLSLIGQEGSMYMSLSGSGVGLHSPLRIQVTAGGALNLNASEMTIQGDEGLQLSTPQHTIELNEFASTLSPKIELQASTRRAHPKIIPPGSPEAMYLQFGGIAMKQDIGIKNAQAQSEAAMGVYKETWNGLCGLATDVGGLVGTGADIAFGEATWEGSRKDLYQRNHILQYAVERGREQQEYIESVRSGERSYGQVAFDALQKSMEIQWAPAIDTIESIKTIVKGSGTINPYASTLEQNQEFGRRSGEASQELLLVASNFIGVGRAAKPAASAAKKLSKAEKAIQGSHHEESGGGKGIGALLGGKDAAKASGIGQGGVKTGATAVLLMARSAISRAGSKGSRLLAGLMSKALVKAEPFKIQRRELVPDTGHGHAKDQGYRYHDKEDHSSSHEREKQKKNLEEGMYSGRRPEKEPDRKHDHDKSKESAPMSSNKPDKVPEKNSEIDKEAGSNEGTGNGVRIPNRITSTPELEEHLKYREYVDENGKKHKNKKGIVGAHNSDEFFKNDVLIRSENKVYDINGNEIKGVRQIEYSMPEIDGKTEKPTGNYNQSTNTKTIYDPNIISDREYVERGIEAVNNSLEKEPSGVLPHIWTGVDSKGVTWLGYYKNGEVTSFFPTSP